MPPAEVATTSIYEGSLTVRLQATKFGQEYLGQATTDLANLASHNRPIPEVLFGNIKDIATEYHSHFVGMTTEPVTFEVLLNSRSELWKELPRRLTARQGTFLVGLAYGQPDWSLLQCAHAADLPALRWKLANLKAFRTKRPADFEAQAAELDKRLG